MVLRLSIAAVAVALVLVGVVGGSGVASASSATQLVLGQSAAFSVLGHSCGGIQEEAYATGFDASSGYPTGDVHLQTRCGGSGRGGGYHTTTYTAWVGVTWDFTRAVVSYQKLSATPPVNPTFSAFDAHGNEVYNSSNNAYLVLSPTLVPAPRLTGISAQSGPASGGTSVTITGTGLTDANGVDFGATPAASFVVNSDTSINAVSAATTASTVDVTVTNAGGTSATSGNDQFTFVAEPSVARLSPNTGPIAGGTAVTITGANFSGATSVAFGDNTVGFTVNSDTSIATTSPVGEAADTMDVTVTSIGGTSAPIAADQFSYTQPPPQPPAVSVTPRSGLPGTKIKVLGIRFRFGATIRVSYITGLRAPHPAAVVVCTVKTGPNGAFSCRGVVPKTAAGPKGAHAIVARATTARDRASTAFKLT